MATILVADDERRVRMFLSRTIALDEHTVITVPDGQAALDTLEKEQVDLLLLDLLMPKRNGLQVLGEMVGREDRTPVIVLSGVTEVTTRIQALELGAVDYVTKPFHTAELMARVHRYLPQVSQPVPGHGRYLSSGEMTLDIERHRVRVGESEVALTAREAALLGHLLRRRGEVCRRDELLHTIWGETCGDHSNVLDVCLGRLRSKIADLPVETIRGVAYCFCDD